MKFKGDIIITDPCYIIKADWKGTKPITKDDWQACNYGSNMEVLGIKTYLTSDTEYGDWSCGTYDDNGNEIGEFCADAGLVSVFLLEEVLAYNPDFNFHIERPWTTTLIKDFDGEVIIRHNDERDEVEVVGRGNINFRTSQTGL